MPLTHTQKSRNVKTKQKRQTRDNKDKEKRIAPDNKTYPKTQFITYFGSKLGKQMWKAAKNKPLQKRKSQRFRKSRKNCAICLEKINEKSTKQCSNLHGEFHEKCINRWIKTGDNTCPMCREPLQIDSGSSTFTRKTLEVYQNIIEAVHRDVQNIIHDIIKIYGIGFLNSNEELLMKINYNSKMLIDLYKIINKLVIDRNAQLTDGERSDLNNFDFIIQRVDRLIDELQEEVRLED